MNNKIKMLISCIVIVFVSTPLVSAISWDVFKGDKMFYVFGDNSSAVPIFNFISENFSCYTWANQSGYFFRANNGTLYNLTGISGGASGGFDGFFTSLDFTGTTGFSDFVDNTGAGSCLWQNISGGILYNDGNVNIRNDGNVYLYLNSTNGVAGFFLNSFERPSYRYSFIDFNGTGLIYQQDADVDDSDKFVITADVYSDNAIYMYPSLDRVLITGGGSSYTRFNDTGIEFPYKANDFYPAELDIFNVRYSDDEIASFSDYKSQSRILIREFLSNGTVLEGLTAAGVPNFHLESSGTSFFNENVIFHGSVYMRDDLTVLGKINAVGGVDPPYISFSKESFDSIRKMSIDVDQDEVMQFWSSEFNRMLIYDIEQDKFFDFNGVEYS